MVENLDILAGFSLSEEEMATLTGLNLSRMGQTKLNPLWNGLNDFRKSKSSKPGATLIL